MKGIAYIIPVGDAFKISRIRGSVVELILLCTEFIQYLANTTCKLERGEQICKSPGPYKRLHVTNHKLCSLQLLVKKKTKKKNSVNSWQGVFPFAIISK